MDVSLAIHKLCDALRLEGGRDSALVEVRVTPQAFDLLCSQPIMDKRWSSEFGGSSRSPVPAGTLIYHYGRHDIVFQPTQETPA